MGFVEGTDRQDRRVASQRNHGTAISRDANFVVEVGDQIVNASAPQTGGWDQFATTEPGAVEIKKTGNLVVKVCAADVSGWKAINLNSHKPVPVTQP